MPKITISNLYPVGSELFDDSESFLNELTDADLNLTRGGCQFGNSSPPHPFTSIFTWPPRFPWPPKPFTRPIFLA